MELGRGPKYEKDSDDLAEALSGTAVKIGLCILLVIVGISILVGLFT
ncbi:hypothetical protein [Brachybacterium sacelli]|uniref:Aa3-type cytochrome c oxidase subunit IV n=1 Tax=Brachybacterium sacelli TaxID=173364 RepID=A0ABS4X5T7_9MICO|nr:hypothetical protein [Brachybacterium sacelli]MBP2383748.1 hypothetical protein [Brachybacterium sacelli]